MAYYAGGKWREQKKCKYQEINIYLFVGDQVVMSRSEDLLYVV
jgi:hypothetical protein